MGYTHYWEAPAQELNDDQWAHIAIVAGAAIEEAKRGDIKVAYEYDQPDRAPLITSETVRFNGVGDEGHETFMVRRNDPVWQFCKTAAKPYDVIVCTILLAMQAVGFKIESDGEMDGEDWASGRTLYARLGLAVAR